MSGTLAERSAITSPFGSRRSLEGLLGWEGGEERVARAGARSRRQDAAVAVDHDAYGGVLDAVDAEVAGHLALPVEQHLHVLAGIVGRLLAVCPVGLGFLLHDLVEGFLHQLLGDYTSRPWHCSEVRHPEDGHLVRVVLGTDLLRPAVRLGGTLLADEHRHHGAAPVVTEGDRVAEDVVELEVGGLRGDVGFGHCTPPVCRQARASRRRYDPPQTHLSCQAIAPPPRGGICWARSDRYLARRRAERGA